MITPVKNIFPIIAACLTLSGCAGTNFEWDNARQIKAGMTEQEVTNLMGAPYLVRSESGKLTWVWSYANTFDGVKTVSVVFVDGKVTEPPPAHATPQAHQALRQDLCTPEPQPS